jgi:hypothetical protein
VQLGSTRAWRRASGHSCLSEAVREHILYGGAGEGDAPPPDIRGAKLALAERLARLQLLNAAAGRLGLRLAAPTERWIQQFGLGSAPSQLLCVAFKTDTPARVVEVYSRFLMRDINGLFAFAAQCRGARSQASSLMRADALVDAPALMRFGCIPWVAWTPELHLVASFARHKLAVRTALCCLARNGMRGAPALRICELMAEPLQAMPPPAPQQQTRGQGACTCGATPAKTCALGLCGICCTRASVGAPCQRHLARLR